MTTQIETGDYASHQEVLIYAGDEKVRFWLPKDRPLKHIIEAILSADPNPFRSGVGSNIAYDLRRENPDHAGDTSGEAALIDQTLDLLRLQLGAGEGLRLVRRSLPEAFIGFPHGGGYAEWSLAPGLVIGNSKGQKVETANMLDLYEYVRGEWTINISRRHARIIDHDGQYYLEVLHPHGVWANDRFYENGDRFKLIDGLKITIIQQEMLVRVAE